MSKDLHHLVFTRIRAVMRIQLSLLAALLLAAPSATEADKSVQNRIVCYYDTWVNGTPEFGHFLAEDTPINLCTHVIYTFVDLSEKDWTIKHLDKKFDIAEKELEGFVAMKIKNPQLKLSVAIGGAGEVGDKFSQIALKKERRDAFITSVVQFLNKYGLDGLDLYWHNPTGSDKKNFVLLVNELKKAFDKAEKGWKITISVSVINLSFEGYDELCSLVDAVHVLNYDLRGKWDVSVDVHSPPHKRPFDRRIYEKMNLNVGIKQWVDYGCPAHKLIVPFYVRTYDLRKGYKNYGLRTKTDEEVRGRNASPYTLTKELPSYHEVDERWIDKWNDIGSHTFTYKDYNWVAYENEKSTQMKIDWLKTNGYGGAVLYFAAMDGSQGKYGEEYHLLKTIHKGMKDYKVPLTDLALTPRKLSSNPLTIVGVAEEEKEEEAFDTSNEEIYGTINDDLCQSPSNKNPAPPKRPPCRPPPHKPLPPVRPPCRPPPHKPPPAIRPPCRPPPHKPPPHYPIPPTRPPTVSQPTSSTAKPTTPPSTSTAPTTAPTTTAPTTAPTTTDPTTAPTTTAPTTAPTTTAPTTAPTTTAPTTAPTTTAPTTAPTTTAPTTVPTTVVPTTSSTQETTTQRPPQEDYPEPNCKNFPNDMYFPHMACDKFYQCTSKTSFSVIKCSTRTIWSQTALTCVHPAQADRIECRNWYDNKSNA